jgi:hypothetical protein
MTHKLPGQQRPDFDDWIAAVEPMFMRRGIVNENIVAEAIFTDLVPIPTAVVPRSTNR